MTAPKLRQLIDRTKETKLGSDVTLLRDIASLEWEANTKQEVGLYCEVLLRTNAEIIFAQNDSNRNTLGEKYFIFNIIRNKIFHSNLMKSNEFYNYYSKFEEYLEEYINKGS